MAARPRIGRLIHPHTVYVTIYFDAISYVAAFGNGNIYGRPARRYGGNFSCIPHGIEGMHGGIATVGCVELSRVAPGT